MLISMIWEATEHGKIVLVFLDTGRQAIEGEVGFDVAVWMRRFMIRQGPPVCAGTP